MQDIKTYTQRGIRLANVAMGKESADLVIQNGKLVNVNTLEIQEGIDVAIAGDRIALVGDAGHCIGDKTIVIDATNQYITPGFMDGHIHVESSFLTVSQYSNSVLPHGTSAIFMDPHEIANVLGVKGVELMMEEASQAPLRVYTTIPSCVPAAPGLEDTGGSVSLSDIENLIQRDDIIGLGEMMNFPGVISGDPDVHSFIAATLANKKCVTGHFSIPETGKMLNAYISSGTRSCHETVRSVDAVAKMRLGQYVKIREGSAWHDLKEVIKAITEQKVSSRFGLLVSDDSHPRTLNQMGHLDHIVKRAIEEGVNPIEAISMVSLNVAECFFLSQDFGSVSPGKMADINLLNDLTTVQVDQVIIGGKQVAENGHLTQPHPQFIYPDWAKNSVKLKAPLEASDFTIQASGDTALANVIEIQEAKVGTTGVVESLQVIDGSVAADAEKNIAKVAVFERHKATGSRGLGFVKGFNFKAGAVASTYAHDAHNLLIVGTNDADMVLAGNQLAASGGGFIAVKDGKIIALLPLPIAGLMSDQPAADVEKEICKLENAWVKLGCELVSPFMTMSLLALAVIPDIRITNKGLFDVLQFKFIDVLK